MGAGTRRSNVLRRRGIPSGPEAGFTLIEVVVSTVIIGIVMSSLITFFIGTVVGTSRQFGIQTAAQLADDAVESVRAVRGSSLLYGRTQAAVEAQWLSPIAGTAPYLAVTELAWDTDLKAGATPLIPLLKAGIDRDGLKFAQHFYIGDCWEPAASGDCTTDASRPRLFYRVVVAVTWSAKTCPGDACAFVTSTLVGTDDSDPVFNPNAAAAPASIVPPGDQTGEVTVPVDLTVTATGGAPPLTWSASGLPPGVDISSDGHITGTPTTAGVNSVLLAVTDGFGLVGTNAFTWTISALPTLSASAQSSRVNVVIPPFNPTRAGGTNPLAFVATGLPTGLAINASTGTVSGTPTVIRPPTAVTITVTDGYGKKATASFTWAVTVT